jgi:hypothetical protein
MKNRVVIDATNKFSRSYHWNITIQRVTHAAHAVVDLAHESEKGIESPAAVDREAGEESAPRVPAIDQCGTVRKKLSGPQYVAEAIDELCRFRLIPASLSLNSEILKSVD